MSEREPTIGDLEPMLANARLSAEILHIVFEALAEENHETTRHAAGRDARKMHLIDVTYVAIRNIQRAIEEVEDKWRDVNVADFKRQRRVQDAA